MSLYLSFSLHPRATFAFWSDFFPFFMPRARPSLCFARRIYRVFPSIQGPRRWICSWSELYCYLSSRLTRWQLVDMAEEADVLYGTGSSWWVGDDSGLLLLCCIMVLYTFVSSACVFALLRVDEIPLLIAFISFNWFTRSHCRSSVLYRYRYRVHIYQKDSR